MTTQPPTIEERVSRLEGSHERIGDLVHQFEGFRTEVNARFRDLSAQIESHREEATRQSENTRTETSAAVRNLYVIIGGSWATLMATIIGLNLAT